MTRLGLVFAEAGEGGEKILFEGEELAELLIGEAGAQEIEAAALLRRLCGPDLAARLLAGMAARRPESESLRRLAEEARVATPRRIRMDPGIARRPVAPEGTKIIRPQIRFLKVEIWLKRLKECQARVCRVEIGGRALGTGFLVGPAAVLTNWHVVEKAAQAGTLATTRCRFDYVHLADGRRGVGSAAAVAAEPLAVWSPYHPAEAGADPESALPGAGELDFALLRLAEPVGREQTAEGRRGWYALPAAPVALAPDDPLLILQHPGSAPMQLAMDTQSVIGPNGNGTRVRYRTNTEAGSSGAPAFTLDGELALLHHLGDPSWGAPNFNQGVPLHWIRAAILEAGAEAELHQA